MGLFDRNAYGSVVQSPLAPAGGGGGSFTWATPVDANITLDTDNAYDFGDATNRLKELFVFSIRSDSPGPAIYLPNGELNSTDGNLSIVWQSRSLFDESSLQALSWRFRYLTDGAELVSVSWGSRALIDDTGTNSVNWQFRSAYDNTNNTSIDWNGRNLLDAAGGNSLGWNSRTFVDSTGTTSVAYESRQLVNALGAAVIDYSGAAIFAGVDNTVSVGTAGNRYSELYTTQAAIVAATSFVPSWSDPMPAMVVDGTTAESIAASGSAIVFTGNGNDVFFLIVSQDRSDSDPTPSINVRSGYQTGSSDSGFVNVWSGATNSGSSGLVQMFSGNSTSGASGDVKMRTGSAGTTRGSAYAEGRHVYLTPDSNLFVPTTVTAGGTTGNQTINKVSGTVNFAAAATALTVTNSIVTADSIVLAVVRTNDATAEIKNVVPAAGSFTINLSAAATAETSVGFFVIN